MPENRYQGILQVGDVLLSTDILTEQFCCDLSQCKGACCVEGDAGAPVTLDEVAGIEDVLDEAWPRLSAQAQSVIDRQGVAYTDQDGDLVTSIVGGKDCVFTCYADLSEPPVEGCCLCALECLHREKGIPMRKPMSCSLYPIREKTFSNGSVGLNYHQWSVCQPARELGKRLGMPVYRFLKEPLTRRFGSEWYEELCAAAEAYLSL